MTECLVVVLEAHDNIDQSLHNYIIFHSWPCLSRRKGTPGPRAFKLLQHTMAPSGADPGGKLRGGDDRMEEIARMIGGIEITDQTRKFAKEMLEN